MDGALTILKIAIVVFIVVVGFFYIKAENFTPFIPPSEPAASTDGSGVSAVMEQPLWQWATGMTPSIYGIAGIISGAALVFFAFLGFDVVATTSEETVNPKKNVPLGIGVGMGLIIVLYTSSPSSPPAWSPTKTSPSRKIRRLPRHSKWSALTGRQNHQFWHCDRPGTVSWCCCSA